MKNKSVIKLDARQKVNGRLSSLNLDNSSELYTKVGTEEHVTNELAEFYNENINISRIVDASVATSYNLDHSLASDWKLTLTGDTTITESNLPTGTDTLEFTIKITGNFALTLPAYWTSAGDEYDGAVWNFIAFQVHNGNVGFEEVTVFLTNLP